MSYSQELKAAFETEVKNFDEARVAAEAGVEVKGSEVSIPAEAYAAVAKHKKNIEELKGLMTADADVKELKSFADEDQAARFGSQATSIKAVADMLLDSPEYKDMLDNNRSQMTSDVELDFANVTGYGTKDVYGALGGTANPGSTNYGFAINRQQLPLVEPLKLNSRVRDLFPTASTQSNVLEYFRSSFTNGAATVAERTGTEGDDAVFGLKPQSNLGFTFVSDQVRLIAHWIAVHRNTLADKAQVRSLIDDSLLYGLALEEDDQLLNGNGSGENIQGVLNRTGVQTYTGLASDQYTDQLRRAMTKVELARMQSTGLVVHPSDWEKLELQKAFSNGNYMVSTVVTGGVKRMWQVPVVSTSAIAEGTFLLGAFGQAAQVYDREKASIRVAEQHADFFARNAVVILAEERLALTTPRPEGLVKGTFTTPVPASINTYLTGSDVDFYDPNV